MPFHTGRGSRYFRNLRRPVELLAMFRVVVLLPFLSLLAGCTGWSVSHGTTEDRRSAIDKAAGAGDVTEVRRFLASGADPNDRSIFGAPLNSAAAHSDNVETIRVLLAAGANPNGHAPQAGWCSQPPLWIAASSDHIETVRALLEAGASTQPSKCATVSLAWLNPSIVELLVQHGRNLHALDEHGRNQLHLAFVPPMVPRPEAVEYLVRSGVALNARDSSGKTPLAYWKEPRDFETRWFTTWLFDQLSNDSFSQAQRADRGRISAFLERSGATP